MHFFSSDHDNQAKYMQNYPIFPFRRCTHLYTMHQIDLRVTGDILMGNMPLHRCLHTLSPKPNVFPLFLLSLLLKKTCMLVTLISILF